MADSVVIELAGEPVPKGRPKFRTGHGRVFAYTPSKTRDYESALRYAAQQAMGTRALIEGPVSVSVVAKRMVPQSWSQRRQREALAGRIHPSVRPDLDNYEKCLDALNGIVFVDDAQIVHRTSCKIYSDKPGLRIEVTPFAIAAEQAEAA